jgi:protein gp37
MPDGAWAECYAKRTAEGIAKKAYPAGFAYHYSVRNRLKEPEAVKEPARIFAGSMSDPFAHYVPDNHIFTMMGQMRLTPQHTFLTLTKHAPGLRKWADQLPPNLHVGVSMPPTEMWGRALSQSQQFNMMHVALKVLAELRGKTPVRWLSLEPLSWDVSGMLWGQARQNAVDWIVIGAATNGKAVHQPNERHVRHVLSFASHLGIPVYMKRELDWPDRQEDFPEVG